MPTLLIDGSRELVAVMGRPRFTSPGHARTGPVRGGTVWAAKGILAPNYAYIVL